MRGGGGMCSELDEYVRELASSLLLCISLALLRSGGI